MIEGMKITQRTPIASKSEAFQRFAMEWTKRWDKRRQIHPQQWDQVLGFIDLAFPQKQQEVPELNVESWHATVKSKAKKTAAGMEGVSKVDLMSLSLPLEIELVQLLSQVENSGEWPEAMCHGAVHSLQKTAEAAQASEYRPITVLSLPYRVWSSLRCKQAMDALLPELPDGMMGSVAGRSSTGMWYASQAVVEVSQVEGTTTCGASVDVVKCFNTLPQKPLLFAALKRGPPPGSSCLGRPCCVS